MYLAKRTLEDLKNNGYELDFSTVFNKSFDHFKKMALISGIGLFLLTLLFMLFFGIAVFGFAGISWVTDSKNAFDVRHFEPLELFFYWLVTTIISVVGFPISAGFIQMARDASRNIPLSLGTIFKYYAHPKTAHLLMAGALVGGFNNLLSTLLNYVDWQVFGILTSFVISFLTLLTVPLIILDNQPFMQAIEGSIQIIFKQLILILGLWLISIMVAVCGIFGLCVGIFFTIPFLYALQYTLYAEIIGDPEPDESQTENSTENSYEL